MKTYKYINTFHNTEARSTLSPEDFETIEYEIACKPWEVDTRDRAKRNRIHRELCGMNDCHCGAYIEYVESE